MKHLILPEDVRTRMGIDPALAPGVDPVIESYITSAQLRAESALQSIFDAAEYTDKFLVDSTLVAGVVPNGYHRLLLTTGFLQADTAPVLTYEVPETDEGFNIIDDGTSGTVPDTDYIVDYERGVIKILQCYEGNYISVGYKAGFDDTHAAPAWLAEVLISACVPLMNALQPTNKSSSAESFYKAVNRHIDDIVANHRRDLGLVMKPI